MEADREKRLLQRLDAELARRRQKRTADAVLALLREPHPWRGQTICCGHDDGVVTFPTWDEADAFREAYIGVAPEHDRAVIVSHA